jgi:magnesium-transporting ATPase (P-type)
VLTRRRRDRNLGSATVICTDKTGTLTENRMSIAELRLADDDTFRPGETQGTTMPDASTRWSRANSPARAIRSIHGQGVSRLGGERLAGTGPCLMRNGN